jgi:hypothetical protein
MTKWMGRSVMLAACLCSAGGIAFAQSQQTQSTETPAQASAADHSLFDAKGLPLGAFRLFPTLQVGAAYDDNVFRTDTGAIDDWFFSINPSFLLTSEWSRHMVRLRVSYDDYLYARLTDESRADFTADADGRLDLGDGITVTGTTGYSLLHESRTSVDLPSNALKQTRYSDLHAGLDVDHSVGRLGLRAGATFDHYEYDPTLLSGGGLFDNRDRNRNEYETYLKGDYEFSPGYAVFLRASYNDRVYDLNPDFNGFDRDNSGYRVDAGLDMKLTQLIEGSFYVGYLRQNYNAPLRDVSGVDYGASLKWYAAELVTVTLSARHTVDETTLTNAAANNLQQVNLNAEYSFRHDIVFTGGIGYAEDRFSGAGRTDRIVTGQFAAKYLMNEYVFWNLGYQYSTRSSTTPASGFNDNTVMLSLGLQL